MPWQKTAAGDLSVAERNLTLGQARFLRVDDGSALMNVNGLAAGVPAILWNGTGPGDAGGDWAHEAQGTEEAAANHTPGGTNGLDSGVRTAGQESRFDNGANIDIDGTYDTLSFWMNPQAFPAGARLDVRWRTSGGGTPGNKLNVADYVTNFDVGVWQKVTIPISDFNLGATDVAKLVFIYAAQGGQHFYIDDIELGVSAAGGPYTFRVVAPDAGTRYHISMLVMLFSGASAGWNADKFANIAALPNGLLLRQRNITSGEVAWSLNSKDNTDLFGRFHPQDDITFADGTLLVGFMLKPGKASVIVTNEDVLEVVVRDDLSGLAQARGFAHFGVEVV